jgi:hypothetical protein
MRQIDDPHHPEHDRQARADEREKSDHVDNLEQNDGQIVHTLTTTACGGSPKLDKGWSKPP